MANWLVTGGCGFIGSHLVDALVARGDRVRVLDDLSSGKRENLAEAAELVVGDVADRHITARAAEGADGIFHLAAVASVERCAQDWVESPGRSRFSMRRGAASRSRCPSSTLHPPPSTATAIGFR
jgi:UDP-glucose 4-epimerase